MLCSYWTVCYDCIFLVGGRICVLYSMSYFSLHQNLPLFSESFFWNLLEYIHGLGQEFGAGDSLGKREIKHFAFEYLTWSFKKFFLSLYILSEKTQKHSGITQDFSLREGFFCRRPLSIYLYSQYITQGSFMLQRYLQDTYNGVFNSLLERVNPYLLSTYMCWAPHSFLRTYQPNLWSRHLNFSIVHPRCVCWSRTFHVFKSKESHIFRLWEFILKEQAGHIRWNARTVSCLILLIPVLGIIWASWWLKWKNLPSMQETWV